MNKQFSIYSDLIRFIAACLVFISHASGFSEGILWQLSGLAHEAVVFFFVLSGFVISFVVNEKKETGSEYLVNRLTRIYSVAIPAIILTIVTYYISLDFNPAASNLINAQLINPNITLISALFFFNQSWIAIPFFSNLPYWSLGYEVLYYVFFGIYCFIKSKIKYTLILMVVLLMGPSILLYLPIWLLGSVSFSFTSKYQLSKFYAIVWSSVSVICIYIFTLKGIQSNINAASLNLLGSEFYSLLLKPAEKFASDYILAIFIAMNIIAAHQLSKHISLFNTFFEKKIRWFSSHTFSLYLLHMPLMFLIAAFFPLEENKIINLSLTWLITPILIFKISSLIEGNKKIYSTFFKKHLLKLN